MFEVLIRKYYTLTPVELNVGSGGAKIQTDKIGADSYEVVKQAFGPVGTATMVDSSNPLPVTDAASEAALASIAAEDFATQTTLAAILAKIIAAPSTEAKQDAIIALLTAIDGGTAAALGQAAMAASVPVVIASNQSAVPISGTVTVDTSLLATAAKQDTQITAEQAILAKIIAAPATEAKQDTGNTSLATIAGKDFATQTTLAAILAKIIAAPATEAKQDTGNTSLASILAKIIAAPATEAKQDTGNTSLASILAKIIAAPATEAKQDTQITAEQAIQASVATPTTIFNGKTTVTTAGTRVTLAASQAVKSVTIKALSTNTGFIYVGNATVASTNGYQLLAGDSISMDIANLTTLNIDSSVNGEGVSYIGVN